MDAQEIKWETVQVQYQDDTNDILDLVHRMRVPGGWIYEIRSRRGACAVFVPDYIREVK